jgi:hypothetical protein
VGRGSTSVE